MCCRFERVVKLAGKELSSQVNKFILHIEESQKEKVNNAITSKKSGDALKKKVLRETKTIPKVVFAIESFSKFMARLSNKTKVDLSKFIGQGTTRDFRIKDLKSVIGKSEADEFDVSHYSQNDESPIHSRNDTNITSDADDDESDNEESDGPPRKKSRN